MKRLICFALTLTMLISVFPIIGVIAADSEATETKTLFYQTYEDDCTYTDLKTSSYGTSTVAAEKRAQVSIDFNSSDSEKLAPPT